MSARFTLDEDMARAWLQRAIAASSYEMIGHGSQPRTDEELPEIADDWEPRDFGEEYTVETVVRFASEAGIIGKPDGMELYFEYVDDTDGGSYQFLVYAKPNLKLASHSEEMRRVGTPDTEGLTAAMDILREAVQSANGVLEALEEYVTARR